METLPCIYREMMIMVMKMAVMEVKKKVVMEEMMVEAAGELLEMIDQVVEIIETIDLVVVVIEEVEEVIIETEEEIEVVMVDKKNKEIIQSYSSEDLKVLKLKIKLEKYLVNLEKLKV